MSSASGILVLADGTYYEARFYSDSAGGGLTRLSIVLDGKWTTIKFGQKMADQLGKTKAEVFPFSAIINRGTRPKDVSPPGWTWHPGKMSWVPEKEWRKYMRARRQKIKSGKKYWCHDCRNEERMRHSQTLKDQVCEGCAKDLPKGSAWILLEGSA